MRYFFEDYSVELQEVEVTTQPTAHERIMILLRKIDLKALETLDKFYEPVSKRRV